MKAKLLIVLALYSLNLFSHSYIYTNGEFAIAVNSDPLYTAITDENFEQKLIDLGIDTGPIDHQVLTSSVASITTLDVSNDSSVADDDKIHDLTGIEDFTALTFLDCHGNNLTNLDLSHNVALITLNCYSNTPPGTSNFSLNISQNINLTTLNCRSSFLSALDVSHNVALTSLDCSINNIETLDVSNNATLVELKCYLNSLKALNVSNNLALTTLHCYSNLLTKLNISKNLALRKLYCSSNNLIVLNVSKNVALTALDCRSNDLVTLDISKNVALTTLDCKNNMLEELNVKNGNNNRLNTIDFRSNSSLSCIQVDNVSYSNTNWSNKKDVSATYNTYCPKIYTLIPDLNFENKLIALGIDIGLPDERVLTASIIGIPNLSVSSISIMDSIADLTGIEDFTALQTLNCSSNQLTELDISKNVNLNSLNCSSNQLTNLNVAQNLNLNSLNCSSNQLTNLNVAQNLNLNSLNCSSNQLTNLSVAQNLNLNSLNCSSNQLTSLEISENIKLSNLDCSDNQLTVLDVFEKAALISLNCSNNQFITLDVSENKVLIRFDCSANPLLTNVNVKNSNNHNFDLSQIDFTGNPNLVCIQVDDEIYSNTNWASFKDLTANYNAECDRFYTLIPDANFEEALFRLQYDSGVKDGKVLTRSISKVKKLDVSQFKDIKDMTGIEDFMALTELYCSNTKVTTLDLSNNEALTILYCYNNKLESLNVSQNVALTTLKCYSNELTTLNISNNINLTTLICNSNKLTTLYVSQNKALTTLYCYSNLLTTLDVSQNLALNNLRCFANQLAALDISKNIVLTHLECDTNELKSLDVSQNKNLIHLECEMNKLTNLDVSQNVALTTLYCFDNLLTSLDISKNVNLTAFRCNMNKLSSLNLKNGKNTLFNPTTLSFTQNPNLTCIEVDDVTYSNTNWKDLKDTKTVYNIDCNAIVLPSNNFAVEFKGESCANEKNGEINITANASYAYVAKINGTNYNFTNNSLRLSNLPPATYAVTISIPGEIFNQNFSIVISPAATIVGKSSLVANRVSVEIIQGTAPYRILVDGIEQFETMEPHFSLDLKEGGLLEVKTAKACEGIYSKEVTASESLASVYPNPTIGPFEIELSTSKKEVAIGLYSTDGQLISQKTYTIENRKVQLTLENQSTGLYIIKVNLDTPNYLKIIKN